MLRAPYDMEIEPCSAFRLAPCDSTGSCHPSDWVVVRGWLPPAALDLLAAPRWTTPLPSSCARSTTFLLRARSFLAALKAAAWPWALAGGAAEPVAYKMNKVCRDRQNTVGLSRAGFRGFQVARPRPRCELPRCAAVHQHDKRGLSRTRQVRRSNRGQHGRGRNRTPSRTPTFPLLVLLSRRRTAGKTSLPLCDSRLVWPRPGKPVRKHYEREMHIQCAGGCYHRDATHAT